MGEVTSKVIPVAEEEFIVEKCSIDMGGVRLTEHVREQEEIIDELLQQERILS